MAVKRATKRVETTLENLLFSSRWLLAPFYFGLAISLIVLLIKFLIELAHLATGAFSYSESDVILGLLTLVDLTLTGSLLIIVIFSGYENFVSKMDHSDHSDRPLLALSDRIAGHAEHAAESTAASGVTEPSAH